jgi:tetrahydromethanopterin S-methyltransferase subunit F
VNYDGINVYGDEVTTNIKGVAAGLLSAGAIVSHNLLLLIVYCLIIM